MRLNNLLNARRAFYMSSINVRQCRKNACGLPVYWWILSDGARAKIGRVASTSQH